MNPRFTGENFDLNLKIVEIVKAVADRRQVQPSQVALAWVLAQGDHLVPIPGTKKLKYLQENIAAAELILTEEDLSDLAKIQTPIGLRYPEASMSLVAG